MHFFINYEFSNYISVRLHVNLYKNRSSINVQANAMTWRHEIYAYILAYVMLF